MSDSHNAVLEGLLRSPSPSYSTDLSAYRDNEDNVLSPRAVYVEVSDDKVGAYRGVLGDENMTASSDYGLFATEILGNVASSINPDHASLLTRFSPEQARDLVSRLRSSTDKFLDEVEKR